MIYRLQRAVATTKTGFNQQPIKGITFVEFGNGRFGTEGITMWSGVELLLCQSTAPGIPRTSSPCG